MKLLPLLLPFSAFSAISEREKSSKIESSQFLKRAKRAWQFFEETKQGNLERECIEEECSYEECYEVTDQKNTADALWTALKNCKNQRGAGKANVRNCVDKAKEAHWEQWTAWSQCSSTCSNPKYSTPYRERSRVCIPSIIDGNYCITEVQNRGVRGKITIDGDDEQREEAQTESCEDLPMCDLITAELSGRIMNRNNAVFITRWRDTSGFSSKNFNLQWFINGTAVAKVPAQGTPVYYNTPDIDRKRLSVSADYQGKYSELTLYRLTEEDFDSIISIEIRWDEYVDREEISMREVLEN